MASYALVIVPVTTPKVRRHCRACGQRRGFESSGKFRLNANGRRLDAWLVYKCEHCGATWNHTIFERKNPDDLDPDLLGRITTNDEKTARRYAFAAPHDRTVEYRVEGQVPAPPGDAEIRVVLDHPVDVRLDRLLGRYLGVSRSAVRRWCDDRRALRKPVRDQQRVRLAAP